MATFIHYATDDMLAQIVGMSDEVAVGRMLGAGNAVSHIGNTLLYHTEYMQITGNLTASILLNQFLYWYEKNGYEIDNLFKNYKLL